jgi:NhaP-type Na+/H+ or K+/H+ antiporter
VDGVSILLIVVVLYALAAKPLDRRSISAPMVFVVVGLVLGPSVLGMLDLTPESHVVLAFTEFTLAMLLFADATTVQLRDAGGDAGVTIRLLAIGLPLTIIVGTMLGLAIAPELGIAGAALIASVLAPTDAALGMAVVADRAVPVRIRRALNIESGLNDGIVTPFVTLFLAVVLAEEGGEAGSSWAVDAVVSLGLAVVVAAAVGGIGGRLLDLASRRGWTTSASEQLCVLAIASVSYVGAVAIGGNGFVSAFAAGLVFRASTTRTEGVRFTEDASLFASFLVWVIFGSAFVGPLLTGPVRLDAIVYAVGSLTLVRMIPVALALAGTRFGAWTVSFMGWFGPRGLASVVFTLIAIEDLGGSSLVTPVFQIATWTILLSVILHGITARPLARAYGTLIRGGDPSAPELIGVAEPRPRRHLDGTQAAPSSQAGPGSA